MRHLWYLDRVWSPGRRLLSVTRGRNALFCGLGLLFSIALSAATTSTGWAQSSAGPATPASKKPAFGPNKPAASATKKGASGKGAGQPEATNPPPVAAPPADPNQLPPGYKPPAEPPDLMTLDKPLLTKKEEEDFKKIRSKYSTAMRNGSMAPADKALIQQGIKYRLYVMTLPEERRQLHERRMDLVATDLQQAGKILKADDVKEFRRYVMDSVVKLVDPLLQNNFYVRLQAATLLGELDLLVNDVQKNHKHETYAPACEPLIKVLDDPQQPTAVKIAAARSLVRLVRYGDVPVELRHKITASVLPELAKTDTHYWYQMRLAEVLSTLDIAVDLQNRKPVIVQGLLAVVGDPQRDFRVRAEAARALGRVPLDAQVDISQVMRTLMKLAQEMATAAQQDPQLALWKKCFFDLYLAYKPADENDREASRKGPAGLLNNAQAATAAQGTYRLIVPIVNAVLNNKPVAVPDVQALQAWLQKNAPNAPLPAANNGQAPKAPAGAPQTTAGAP